MVFIPRKEDKDTISFYKTIINQCCHVIWKLAANHHIAADIHDLYLNTFILQV